MVVGVLACASGPNVNHGASAAWPGGSEPQLVRAAGVGYGQQGTVRFVTAAPRHVLLLELRPSLDSLDVRRARDYAEDMVIDRTTDIVTTMETVDALRPGTVSQQFSNCTTVRMGAGDPDGTQVCPVSRSDVPEGRRWRFRNRVFLLISDKPFAMPLPQAIRWASRSTIPPVLSGAKWTAVEL